MWLAETSGHGRALPQDNAHQRHGRPGQQHDKARRQRNFRITKKERTESGIGFCDGGAEDDNNSEPRMNIVLSTISSTAMHMQYIATDEDFQSDYHTKVRCRY